MLKTFFKVFFLLAISLSIPSCSTGKKKLTPAQALHNLMEGNKRYIQGHSIHPDETEQRREMTLTKQEPFAVIVGCSDSRVPPEIVFDQGLGDIFVIRVAGNVVGPLEQDSIEFAAEKLNAPLILVLGHQNCGAVTAVANGQAKENDIENIAPFIEPAIEKAKTLPGNFITNCILENVKLVVAHLKANPVLA